MADAVAVFEATHGSVQNMPERTGSTGSIILSAEMMLRYIGWTETLT